ncbi:sugar-phosphatase [Actinomycetospora cinnamomea]|uniref:Sugar-phosphatase n=1 Tax=Actinomycetospora cinnamomea TaxID=663609 RepID=A0A2U1FQI4_9PSEU|nr:sugar-phosphatase [Actinomycetospora cinnamomea]
MTLHPAVLDRPDSFAAVLLDMDGTLVDSDGAVERSWRTWARRWGVDPLAVLAVMTGHPAEATVRRVRPDLDEALVAIATRDHLEHEYVDLDDVVAAPGAAELTADLTATFTPWAVVTSADTRLARARLGTAGLEFPVLVPRDMVAAGKPDPEGYLRAADFLGVDPTDCLVVEDTPVGVAAGRAAGATVAGLRRSAGGDADLAIDTLHDVLTLLSREVTA